MTIKKHAFLVMMHNKDNNVQRIINLYDNENIYFFIHVDKKYKDFDYSFTSKKSKIIYIRRKSLVWGTYSLVKCEMDLLDSALKAGDFDYFHLISGNDFVLHNVSAFLKFFSDNKNSYIGLNDLHKSFDNNQKSERTKFYYFLNSIINRNKTCTLSRILLFFQRVFIKAQKIFRIDRNKNKKICAGSQWFSITKEVAAFLCDNKTYIKKEFSYTECPDELFIRTLIEVKNPSFKIVDYNLRLIDWDRGSPYYWNFDDLPEIIDKNDSYYFIRKVKDIKLINELEKNIKKENIN